MAAFAQTTRVLIERELSPQAMRARLAETARDGVRELIAQRRATPRFRRYVDGAADAPEEAVQRIIRYDFSFTAEAAVFALAFLQGRAPVRRGTYRDSFFVSVDGRPIRARLFDPARVPPDAELIIWNAQPYSRKVDVQRAGGRPLRFSVPAGLFDDSARAVRRRFGNAVVARRVYNVSFPAQYVLRTGPRRGTRVQSPALIISPL